MLSAYAHYKSGNEKEAKKLLKELPDVQEVPKKQSVEEPVKQEPVPIKNIYTAGRRRR